MLGCLLLVPRVEVETWIVSLDWLEERFESILEAMSVRRSAVKHDREHRTYHFGSIRRGGGSLSLPAPFSAPSMRRDTCPGMYSRPVGGTARASQTLTPQQLDGTGKKPERRRRSSLRAAICWCITRKALWMYPLFTPEHVVTSVSESAQTYTGLSFLRRDR